MKGSQFIYYTAKLEVSKHSFTALGVALNEGVAPKEDPPHIPTINAQLLTI